MDRRPSFSSQTTSPSDVPLSDGDHQHGTNTCRGTSSRAGRQRDVGCVTCAASSRACSCQFTQASARGGSRQSPPSAGHTSTIPRNRPCDRPPRRAAQGEWPRHSRRARCVCARRSFRHSYSSSGTCRPVQGALDSGGGPIREPVNEPGPAARAVRPDVPSGRRPAGRAIHADSLTPSRYVYKAPETIVTIRLGGS